jgi:hypothetical protein
MVFSLQSVTRCYKEDSWSNELVVGQSPASKNVITKVGGIVGICHQATTGEDTADWKNLVSALADCIVRELVVVATVTCSYNL